MRRCLAVMPAMALAVGALLAVPATSGASGSSLLVVRGDQVTREHDPALPPAREMRLPPPPGRASGLGQPHDPLSTGTAAAVPKSRTVRGAVKRAARSGAITDAKRDGYLAVYGDAVRAHAQLGGLRRSELGDVIYQAQRLARNGKLSATRMPAVFLILANNRRWWASKGAPASGTRVRFAPSRIIFQYYPGHGMQFQPLANFGYASGQWLLKSKRHRANLKRLLDELVAIRSHRGTFTTWEYYFPFGGGVPPWTSGMSQGTALQALSRGAEALGDPHYIEIAAKALPAFRVNTPTGVRVPTRGGAWYALYSFAPSQKVLNGFIQSLVGIWDYREFSGDRSADVPFQQGERVARAMAPRFDTGAWSLYELGGAESDLNYHTIVGEFLRSLCVRSKRKVFCDEGNRFQRYLKTAPRFSGIRVGRRAVSFRLSKVSTVSILVKRAGRVVAFRRLTLTWRHHRLPFGSGRGRAVVKLSATDLAGNRSRPIRAFQRR